MIVVDEQIHGRRILEAIDSWYSGQVVSITQLCPNSIIKDDAIPSLLLQVRQPTFITINADDFWRRIAPHQSYCIVAFAFPKERRHEVPPLLRDLFRLEPFKTKSRRMGKMIRGADPGLAFYEANQRIQQLDW